MNDSERQLVEQTRLHVVQRMGGQQAGHGLDHVWRVVNSAREIQAQIGGDRLVVELSALLHDIGDAKFNDGVERSAEFSRIILIELGASLATIDHVVEIVDNISFRKGIDPETLSLEGKIVQDADRLDALGAIGIVRTIEYGAVKGQPFYEPGNLGPDSKSGIGHFHEKLFKLRALLNTEPARQIAQQREEFMHQFLNQFLKDCGESPTPKGERGF